MKHGKETYELPGDQFWQPVSGHRAMYVMTGPTCESGQRVQCSVTVDPAAAVAWRGAGAAPVLQVMSLSVTSWTGPFPGMERDTL